MKEDKAQEILKGISPLVSGVLTSLIYDTVSNTTYVLHMDGQEYILNTIEEGLWIKPIGILILYFLLWGLFSKIIPWIGKYLSRFSYRRAGKSSPRELLCALNAAKVSIERLYPVLCGEKAGSSLAKIHVRELANTVAILHKKFVPHSTKGSKDLNKCFRNNLHASIFLAEKKVSAYELSAVVSLLKDMVDAVEKLASEDPLLQRDCDEMKSCLNHLEELSSKLA